MDNINLVLDYMQDKYDIYTMTHSEIWSKCYDYIGMTLNLELNEKRELIEDCVREIERIKRF